MIYDNIKKLCEEKGVSMTEVENSTKLSRGLISKWKNCSPTIDKIKIIADYFGVPVDYFLK